MKRKIILLAILLYISILLIPINALEDGVIVPLVADKMSTNGEQGSFLYARVIVTNGTGHVFVDTSPFTQVDLQGSARIAASVASDVLGIDESKYDFYYIIQIDSPIIGGPSAGGILTVGTIAAIENWTIKPGVAMTGMIDPDDTIGPVGGIPFKLQAAAAKNTTLFLVPQGQLTVTMTNVTTINKGPFVTTQSNEETVDLVQFGKKLNVDVREISTIQDAVLLFTGHDISSPATNNTVYTSNYLDLLKPLALQLKNESKKIYDNTSTINNPLVIEAKDLQNRGNGLINDSKYYAATSLYFQSMLDLLSVQWNYQYSQEQNKDQYIKNLNNIVRRDIQNSENDLNKFKSNGTGDIEVIGAAESRIMEANNTLESINNTNNIADVITSLAFADQRARSAQWWLTLATSSNKTIPDDILKERAGWYMSQAQSIGTYTQSLISESTGHSSISNLFDTTVSQQEIDRGYYSGSIFNSLQTISRLGTAIELLGIQDPSVRINQSEQYAEDAINEARAKGIEPTLAISALEYGGILTNPFEKIASYSYAKMVAKTTESLYLHASSGNQSTRPASILNNLTITPNKASNIPNNVSNVTHTQTNKSPAFSGFISMIAFVLLTIIIKRKLEE